MHVPAGTQVRCHQVSSPIDAMSAMHNYNFPLRLRIMDKVIHYRKNLKVKYNLKRLYEFLDVKKFFLTFELFSDLESFALCKEFLHI